MEQMAVDEKIVLQTKCFSTGIFIPCLWEKKYLSSLCWLLQTNFSYS